MRVEGAVEMSADTRELFSTGDGRLTMREADGWVLTTVRDRYGHLSRRAKTALAELVEEVKPLSDTKALDAGKTIKVFLGFAPEGDHLFAVASPDDMSILAVSPDGIARQPLCGPYPVRQAYAMAEAVISASET